MICIASDTTSEKLTLALIKGDEIFYRCQNVGKSGHSSLLMCAVKELMEEGGVTPDMLDAVAVNVGPGSFTGIRIGVSALTAIAFATGAKKIALTSFDLIAYDRREVIAAVDAGHGNLYAAKCVDGRTVETAFYAADDENKPAKAKFEPRYDAAKTLAKVALQKAERGEYVAVLEPFYMRKSQAEREKDGN